MWGAGGNGVCLELRSGSAPQSPRARNLTRLGVSCACGKLDRSRPKPAGTARGSFPSKPSAGSANVVEAGLREISACLSANRGTQPPRETLVWPFRLGSACGLTLWS